uniref:Mono(ADP-ribosyl)transferase n=1 Tax=Chrysotila carterae TaxID=13221 RepID=A0A7S4F027_CHRCT
MQRARGSGAPDSDHGESSESPTPSPRPSLAPPAPPAWPPARAASAAATSPPAAAAAAMAVGSASLAAAATAPPASRSALSCAVWLHSFAGTCASSHTDSSFSSRAAASPTEYSLCNHRFVCAFCTPSMYAAFFAAASCDSCISALASASADSSAALMPMHASHSWRARNAAFSEVSAERRRRGERVRDDDDDDNDDDDEEDDEDDDDDESTTSAGRATLYRIVKAKLLSAGRWYRRYFLSKCICPSRLESLLDTWYVEKGVLWRGMRDIDAAEWIKSGGGTELATMSTTGDIRVALKYTLGSKTSSLLFMLKIPSFMQQGADLSYLSAFPQERECTYPPLTFIKPTGRERKIVDGELNYHVVEVLPYFPS